MKPWSLYSLSGLPTHRFGGAHHHRFLLDFLKAIADHYHKDNRAVEIVLDLLHLNVPKLLSAEEGERQNEAAATVSQEFMVFLKNYINRHSLKLPILGQIAEILVS